MRNSKGQFEKGFHHNLKWNEKTLIQDFEKEVLIQLQKLQGEKSKICVPPVNYFRNHPITRKHCSGFANRKLNRTKIYHEILIKNGYTLPEKTSGYWIDETVFRGFNEFIAYCFMKAWGLNIIGNPKVFGNYIADGYLVDYDLYWEHWGELNKRNDLKKQKYSEFEYNLISTQDSDATKNGVIWFYYHLKNLLLNKGVEISFEEGKNFHPFDLVRGKILLLDDIAKEVLEIFPNEQPKGNILKQKNHPLFCRVIDYFHKWTDFIIYLNTHFSKNYEILDKDYNVSDINYVVEKLTPTILKLKRFPTAAEIREEQDLSNLACAINIHHGGYESFRRNLYEVGNNFNYVLNILGEDAPFDKTYDFSKDEVFDWAVSYITKKLGKFPKYSGQLRKYWDDDVCKYFFLSIRKNGSSKYDAWGDFQKKYFNDDSSSKKKFLTKMSYPEYKMIRSLIDSGKYTLTKVIELTNSGWGTVGRIKNNHPRFSDYSFKYNSELLSNQFVQFN